jgi:hypothetical protein
MTDATEATVSAKGGAVVGAMIGSLAGYVVPTSSLIFSLAIIVFVGLLGGTVGHVTEYWLIKNRLLSSGVQSNDGATPETEDMSGQSNDQASPETEDMSKGMIAGDQSDSFSLNELIRRVEEEGGVGAVDSVLDKGVFYNPASGTDPIILASADTYLYYQEKITKLEEYRKEKTAKETVEEIDFDDL